MNASEFCVLEHKLPERIGLPLDEIKRRRAGLKQGVDWERAGRWIKWTFQAVEKLKASLGVAEIKAEPPAPEWLDVLVTRVEFPNPRIIEVQEFNAGRKWHVAIHPDWRRCYRPKMPIQIKVSEGDRLATTRRPRGVYRF